ncbi:MAG: DUF2971 domain-containing protein [Anaeromusa sp.]|uniref:DUF2971 domain-containing protein n=1 Tax=Anaeromusa sp. TaxID=1872520 RepID=UPI002B216585|nr:DUF2971 domain-containing protein [Anaeromusa sp.]MEA4835986.1 DUF2971 domain-containing protein [Anaeromusa sp.]
MDNSYPMTIYHYCCMQAFYSIFKGKKFWLSDVFKMNDYNEMVILLDDFEHIIAEEFRRAPFELTIRSQGTNRTTVLNTDKVINLIKELYGKWKYDFVKNESIEYKMFIACFSEKADILSQWSMYADNAQGVSIGFNVASLINLTKENPNFQFIKVKYIDEKVKRNIQEKLARKYLEFFIQDFAKNLANTLDIPDKRKKEGLNIIYTHDDIFDIIGKGLYERCFLDLLRESIRYKSKPFAPEVEWRLIYTPNSNYWNKEPETKKEIEEYNLMQYRLAGNLLVKYISLPLEKIIKNPCMIFNGSGKGEGDMTQNRIVLGPRNQNGRYEMIDFLTTEGFSFVPTTSKITYR